MSTSKQSGPPPSYSTAELARRLGVATPTVQRWVDHGYLKAWKTAGGHRRIDADSAKRFLAEQGLQILDAPPAEASETAADLAVLIVDDNPDDRDLLEALVESALPAATVKVAENGFQALVAIGRSAPDVLVTDIRMPHMDGLEMLRHLSRSDSAQRPKAIVAVSSYHPQQVAELGGLPPGVALVSKPVDPRVFADTLQAAVSGFLPQRRRRGAKAT